MSGFIMVLGFVTCVHFLYILPKPLWNSHDLSYGLETFWAQTRHIHVYFDVKFVNLSYLDCELWIFEVGCDNLCHTIDVQLVDFYSHAYWPQNGLIFFTWLSLSMSSLYVIFCGFVYGIFHLIEIFVPCLIICWPFVTLVPICFVKCSYFIRWTWNFTWDY
jgi:hypothetical protein